MSELMAAAGESAIVKSLMASFVASIKEPMSAKLRRTLQEITDAYGPFLDKTYLRVGKLRTILKQNESLNLLDIYVPVDLTDKKIDVEIDTFIEEIIDGKRFVVSGLAGRGKSVLMRFIALSIYHAPRGRIPLFLELRNLNSLTTKNIVQLIHSQYKGSSSIKLSDFEDALRTGRFIFLLDGFDEITPSDRDEIARQIDELALEYPQTAIVVSGRPDDRFDAWERFTTLYLKPMTLAQTRKLIDKSDYDHNVKKSFLKRLTPDFFSQHSSFLDTPLLAIMMMLTYEEYAEIPQSLHEFYRNTFDTLVRRHDAMKAQFLRETHSKCTAEELKRVFSAFCLLTYSKSAFTFSRDEIIRYLEMSVTQQRVNCDSSLLLKDFIESICILQQEGFEISFVHRSFQEYFCAYFVSMGSRGMVQKFLDSGRYRVYDDVIVMLNGIVPDRVEDEWVRPTVNAILEEFPENDRRRFVKYARKSYTDIEFVIEGNEILAAYVDDTEFARKIRVLRRLYPAHFVSMHRGRNVWSEPEKSKWQAAIKSELVKLIHKGDEQLAALKVADGEVHLVEKAPYYLRIKIHDQHYGLLKATLMIDTPKIFSCFKNLSVELNDRMKGEDIFLSEIFEQAAGSKK